MVNFKKKIERKNGNKKFSCELAFTIESNSD